MGGQVSFLCMALVSLVGCVTQRAVAPLAPMHASSASAPGDLAAIAEAEGDAAWANRDRLEAAQAALSAWERAVSLGAGAGVLVKLSRGCFFLADAYLPWKREDEGSDRRTMKAAYLSTSEVGADWGEKALAAFNPEIARRVAAGEKAVDDATLQLLGKESVPALYWYAANLGAWARAKGGLTVLRKKDTLENVMNRLLELDEGYYYAAPHRLAGALYALAPGLFGGNLTKSLEHFERALQMAPAFVGTRVLLAETYAVKAQKRELFEENLKGALAAPDDVLPELVPETRIEKQKARELLAKEDELIDPR